MDEVVGLSEKLKEVLVTLSKKKDARLLREIIDHYERWGDIPPSYVSFLHSVGIRV